MPIYLPAPRHNPLSVDGNGWNRMAIHGMCNDECALRPKSITAFLDSLDTRRARYGMFGACINKGNCGSCPLPNRKINWPYLNEKMLIRVKANGDLRLMSDAFKGWEESGVPVKWEDILIVNGCDFERYRDEFSDGIMMIKYALIVDKS